MVDKVKVDWEGVQINQVLSNVIELGIWVILPLEIKCPEQLIEWIGHPPEVSDLSSRTNN